MRQNSRWIHKTVVNDEGYKDYARARILRAAQTESEIRMWKILRGRQLGGHKFRRQHPIGRFVLDFFCADKQIAVELDGGIHNEADRRAMDEERTRYLNACGISVMRFTNAELQQNPKQVVSQLRRRLTSPFHGEVAEGG